AYLARTRPELIGSLTLLNTMIDCADDVERASATSPPQAPPPQAPPPAASPLIAADRVAQPAPRAAPLSGDDRRAALRRAMAGTMARSNREIPHYYLAADIELRSALAWLEQRNAARPVTERALPVVLLLKATALALRRTPDLNGSWEQDDFRPADAVHLGVAVALRGGGLVAPAIRDADTLSITELMVALRDLSGRARQGRLRSSEVAEATFTVTSLGDQGVDTVLPVIYPPQVAIVGFGRIRDRPWAVNGGLAVRPVVTAALAGDHRVSDGRRGAAFLKALDTLLQDPEGL
ncbi:2-oxo acid dehydrogenase subunit E2, partial [Cumulibacter manganitolerans]|uniref:2-oxo acid dehydrogenase subunit E2 n=1 Tax=Cumulibacter manganitolerans TaxID=1884992 RepID=UPI001E45F8F0